MSDDGNIQIKLTGHLDVIAAFRDLREELPKNPLRNAVKEAAQFLVGFIALVAPKRTGRLVSNIRVSISTAKGRTSGRVVINNPAYYWRFLELGWHSRDGIAHKIPFIGPLFRQKDRQAAQIVIDACEAQVTKAQNKIRRGVQ